MPRQTTEAAALLNLYKLVIEQKRLQEELQSIEMRQQQIQQRLSTLKSQIVGVELTIPQLRNSIAPPPQQLDQALLYPRRRSTATPSAAIEMEFLDY